MESMKYSDTEFAVSLDPGQVVAEVHANAVSLPKRTVREHISYGKGGAGMTGGPDRGRRRQP